MIRRFLPNRSRRASRLLALFARIAPILAVAPLAAAGCAADPVLAVQDELHPAGGRYVVTATLQPWHRGYYSAAVTIHNESNHTLFLDASMFRLEGTAPTSFVAADRIPMMLGRAGYRMPDHVDPRCTAQGEIFYGIRGTETPKGRVRFLAELPDGEHAFEWSLIQ